MPFRRNTYFNIVAPSNIFTENCWWLVIAHRIISRMNCSHSLRIEAFVDIAGIISLQIIGFRIF